MTPETLADNILKASGVSSMKELSVSRKSRVTEAAQPFADMVSALKKIRDHSDDAEEPYANAWNIADEALKKALCP